MKRTVDGESRLRSALRTLIAHVADATSDAEELDYLDTAEQRIRQLVDDDYSVYARTR